MVMHDHPVGSDDHGGGELMTNPQVDDQPVDDEDYLPPESDEQDVFEDFDAYWAEHGTRPTVRTALICGVEVEVPNDLPLEVEVITRRRGGDLTDTDVERVVELIFGKETFDEWLAKGMTSAQFPIVCAWGMLNGSGKPTTFAEAAKHVEESAERPTNRAERRAATRPRGSVSGRSSSPSSAASTGSHRRR